MFILNCEIDGENDSYICSSFDKAFIKINNLYELANQLKSDYLTLKFINSNGIDDFTTISNFRMDFYFCDNMLKINDKILENYLYDNFILTKDFIINAFKNEKFSLME